MKTGLKKLLCCISLSAITAASVASAENAPTLTTKADEKIDNCIPGLESILPSDYYACRAKYHFQRKHYRQAVETLKMAADWANKDAQYTLGLIYFNGDTPGIAIDRAQGVAWLALAAERKNPVYVRTYLAARQAIDSAELRTATLLFATMNLRYGDKVAGPRAMRNFDHQVTYHQAQMISGNSVDFPINGYDPVPGSNTSVLHFLHTLADKDFEGLQGTVTVGPVQQP
ncbi:hypothetical protein [Rhodanobacter sp. L36]|uniref:hypothetical protein n=1 Tax=Rhodanobacter sp. L36 TaxID=1747221 RepID=UPI00131C1009|nr:hypothetical protein [Rhodanobacter sp. L36]